MLVTRVAEELKPDQQISIVKLLEVLINEAHRLKASDIHIDPMVDRIRVRFRVDGNLQDIESLPRTVYQEIIARIKILAHLRTDEHQTAQDGRFCHQASAEELIDVRVSVVPTYHGENAVLRLLVDQAGEYTLASLGFSPGNQEKIAKAIHRPHGMVLVTGPTGSGKTTTLYTIIKMLNTPDVSIITIEDPIEYAIAGVEQVPVNQRSGLTFASGLRSLLRQDPDIIMVGEIRDTETASLAVNTALTGHLLLSTLHTNDAATSLPRLIDMKVEPFLVASTVNLVVSQRLVRQICRQCRATRRLTGAERDSLTSIINAGYITGREQFSFGQGCKSCNGSGYQGRFGIHEVLIVDNDVQEAILRKASAATVTAIAKKNGMTPILVDGLDRAKAGLTTLEEIIRVVYD